MVTIKNGFFQILGIAVCLVCMFKFPYAVSGGITEGLQICFSVILPSLFPFMVLSNYIIKSNAFSFAYKLLTPISKTLFRQPAVCVPVMIMSMVGGFPVGIKMVESLLGSDMITKKQAQRLCLFCMNGGPAFIITAVGVGMLKSLRAGVIMYASLCISSLILGISTSFLGSKNEIKKEYSREIQSPLSALSVSVSDALQGVLGICAWVVIFSGITNCLRTFIENENLYCAFASFFEVTKGCILLAGKMPVPVITAIIGFGGICVHCQVISSIKNCGLKYSHFLVCRILNGAAAAFISHLLLMIFPVETDVFASAESITVNAFSVSFPAFFTFAVMCIIMIFDIDKKKKIC